MVCLELKMVWKLKRAHKWLHVENILVARRAWNASKQIFNKLWKIRVWCFSALHPLTFKTISLLFPIKKPTSSSRTSNCHRGIRAVEQGYLLKHTTEKVCILDPNRALIYLITCCKNLSSSQPATSPPVSAEPWQQKASQFVVTVGNSQKEKNWRNSYLIGICCPYPRKPSS